ncbi:hypothetical protein O9Z70_04415 [Devosia sp. YIM 151766]|uniref:hypothetical protein n=1 Tax=Devosia sp. YIM 151766 TaxID=3017325 RepID=UPI00255CCB37|nr:hypothetical protein [Devosia sp. YIM 151766]WIY53793.1 hypothetical protein O9Z70_04415 [Devosia sp. YIM 151766]
MWEVVAKILTVSGLLIDFVAVIIGGKAWIYRAAMGVRAAFAWNGRNLANQQKRKLKKLGDLQDAMREKPTFFRMYRIQSHLSGMRLLAWQVDTQNAKHRAQWGLTARPLVNYHGLLDIPQLEINTAEMDAALQERAATGVPRDFSGLAFKLFCLGFIFTLTGALM